MFVQRRMPVPMCIPLDAPIILGYTLYRSVSSGPPRWFPIVSGGWLVLTVIAVHVAPGVSRRLGRALAENEGITERPPAGPATATDCPDLDERTNFRVPPLLPYVDDLRLVDHHCHGVVDRDLSREEFESMLTEAEAPGPLGGTLFDSAIGLAVRRWCAPVLDLPPHAPPEDYLARRTDLGAEEVNRRFLRAAGAEALCLDTGFAPDAILAPSAMGALSGAAVHEVVRLEQLAEEVAAEGPSAAGFAEAFRARLEERTAGAVGVKSIAAYRVGLALPGARPSDADVTAAAGRWLAALGAGTAPRLADVTLQAFLVWCGVDRGLPIQFHVGYGDPDVDLHRCDPLLLTGLIRAVQPSGTPIMLLHNYPFHRHAAYLAQVFPHVFADVGLATHNVGHRAPALIAETLELAPYGKFLFSSDAFGLAELYHLGSLLFRRGLSEHLRTGLDEGAWTEDDAARIARLAGGENARRVYGLER